jgi:hypothetical protein
MGSAAGSSLRAASPVEAICFVCLLTALVSTQDDVLRFCNDSMYLDKPMCGSPAAVGC